MPHGFVHHQVTVLRFFFEGHSGPEAGVYVGRLSAKKRRSVPQPKSYLLHFSYILTGTRACMRTTSSMRLFRGIAAFYMAIFHFIVYAVVHRSKASLAGLWKLGFVAAVPRAALGTWSSV